MVADIYDVVPVTGDLRLTLYCGGGPAGPARPGPCGLKLRSGLVRCGGVAVTADELVMESFYAELMNDEPLQMEPISAVLHGNMDAHALFDTFWMAGLFTEVVAVLPQRADLGDCRARTARPPPSPGRRPLLPRTSCRWLEVVMI